MSIAIPAQGSTFKVNSTGQTGGTMVQVLGIKSFTGLDGSATEIDTTELTDDAKTKLLGLQDWGSFSMDANINFSDPGQAALLALKTARTKTSFLLTLPNGTTVAFDGFVKSLPLAGGVDTVLTGTIALTITGDIVVTPPVAG